MKMTHANQLLYGTVLALLATAVNTDDGRAQAAEEAPLVINVGDAEWGPPASRPRFPLGVRTSQLGLDPDNGGPSYFSRFPPGSHFELHWHTHAEYVVVLSGEGTIVLGDESHDLASGSYIVIPERVNHAWDVPAGDTELVILVRRRGPADFNFVEP